MDEIELPRNYNGHCTECGAVLTPGAKFCTKCGPKAAG